MRAATARRLARCCWPRTATRRSMCTSSSATSCPRRCRAASRRRCATSPTRGGRYEIDGWRLEELTGLSDEQLRAVLGHLARAGVVEPAPAPPDRLVGRIAGEFDGRAAGLCRASMGDAARARWRQYRDIWAYVESDGCRRQRILRHFGDSTPPRRERGVLRRVRRRAAARRCPRPIRCRSRRSTRRSCRWRRRPAREWGARRARRSSTGRARRRSRRTPTTGCPRTELRRTCGGRRSSSGSTS